MTVDDKQTKIIVLQLYTYNRYKKLQFSTSSKGENRFGRNFKGSVDVGIVPFSTVIVK